MESKQLFVSRNNKNPDTIALQRGKLPPQATDLEEAVLGAMMIDKKGVDDAISILKPEAIYKEAHQHIFVVIKKLFDANAPVDLLAVSTQLRKDGKLDLVGGDYYLVELTQKVS